MTRYALAARVRRRLIGRTRRPPATLPAGVMADLWPPAGRRVWSPVRLAWNSLRWVAAHAWSPRWTGWRHPHLRRLGRTLWAVTALALETVALTVGLAVLLGWPLWRLATRAAGSVMVLAGWSPPLSAADIAPAETATLHEPPTTPPPVARSAEPVGDPWEWNTLHDPHLDLQRQAIAEMRRSNDLTAAAHHHHQQQAPQLPTPQAPPAPAAPAAFRAQPVPTAARYAVRRSGSGRWWAARSLLWLSIVMGAVFTTAAWVLAWLSALGVIGEPPTLGQLQTTTPPVVTEAGTP